MKRILKFFGFVPLEELTKAYGKYAEAQGKFEAQKAETVRANEMIQELKTQQFVASQKKELPRPLVGMDAEDPSPTKEVERKLYVGQAAGFHTDILKKKLLSLIADARGQFEKVNRETFGLTQSEYDLFLKGTVNGLWLVHDWGEEMVNEQLSYLTEKDELSDEDKQALKEKINQE